MGTKKCTPQGLGLQETDRSTCCLPPAAHLQSLLLEASWLALVQQLPLHLQALGSLGSKDQIEREAPAGAAEHSHEQQMQVAIGLLYNLKHSHAPPGLVTCSDAI